MHYNCNSRQENRLRVAIEAAKMASEYCELIRKESRIKIVDKADGSPVTVADVGSQLIISHFIYHHFPDDVIVGEEDASSLDSLDLGCLDEFMKRQGIAFEHSKADLLKERSIGCGQEFWTVDPVDGTKGFIRENGQYAVCIAYLDQDGAPLLSVVSAPCLESSGVIAYAERDKGSYASCLGDVQEWKRLSLVGRDPTKILCTSYEAHINQTSVIENISKGLSMSLVKVDSQVKYLLVALGHADAYVRPKPAGYLEKIWDHAPGALIVTEAGGFANDQHGTAMRYPTSGFLSPAVGTIVASASKELNDQICALLE